MNETDRSTAIDDKCAVHLHWVTDRLAASVSDECQSTPQPHSRTGDLIDGSLLQTERPVRHSLRVRKARKGKFHAVSKIGNLLGSTHRDRRHVRPGVEESLIVLSHVDHVLTARRSPEVPKKE